MATKPMPKPVLVSEIDTLVASLLWEKELLDDAERRLFECGQRVSKAVAAGDHARVDLHATRQVEIAEEVARFDAQLRSTAAALQALL